MTQLYWFQMFRKKNIIWFLEFWQSIFFVVKLGAKLLWLLSSYYSLQNFHRVTFSTNNFIIQISLKIGYFQEEKSLADCKQWIIPPDLYTPSKKLWSRNSHVSFCLECNHKLYQVTLVEEKLVLAASKAGTAKNDLDVWMFWYVWLFLCS